MEPRSWTQTTSEMQLQFIPSLYPHLEAGFHNMPQEQSSVFIIAQTN